LFVDLHIALLFLPSARNCETPVRAHYDQQYFLKFKYASTTILRGITYYKYLHCSNEYALLFRDAGGPVTADIYFEHLDENNFVGHGTKLIAMVNNRIAFDKFFPVGSKVKAVDFALNVKDHMWLHNRGCTSTQKVRTG